MDQIRHRRQSGMTLITLALLLVVIAFLALILIKLLPVYLENFSVSTSLSSLEKESGGDISSLKEKLFRRFDINDVKRVERKHVKMVNQGAMTSVTVKYEVRVPMLFNVDAVVMFDQSAKVINR